LRGAVHALKASAALIGADHLRDLAGDLELRVVSGTANDPERGATSPRPSSQLSEPFIPISLRTNRDLIPLIPDPLIPEFGCVAADSDR
jgi:hypothetical protein